MLELLQWPIKQAIDKQSITYSTLKKVYSEILSNGLSKNHCKYTKLS